MKIYSRKDNKIGILGSNILINDKKVTAFYIIDSANYSTLNKMGVNNHIGRLENLISSLCMQKPDLSFSLFTINKTITAEDIKRNLVDTIKLWDPEFKDIPEIFKNHITKNEEKFTLLACNIDVTEFTDIESSSITKIAKEYISNFTTSLLSSKQINIDTDRILKIEKNLNDTICRYGVRASRELTFYAYISSLYPSYEIRYDKNSYITNNMSPILGVVNQELEPHFGYFVMKNSGVEMFNLPAQDTYGCLINIMKFPTVIDSNSFNIAFPNLRLNIRTMSKEKAEKAIKRTRADLEFEEETSRSSRTREDQELVENLNLTELALRNIKNGTILCEMNASILILARDLDKLKSSRRKLITALADTGVLASISIDQAKDFINNYVNFTPTSYKHLCELRYPLSFQINNGTMIGDFDSQYTSPSIGESL